MLSNICSNDGEMSAIGSDLREFIMIMFSNETLPLIFPRGFSESFYKETLSLR